MGSSTGALSGPADHGGHDVPPEWPARIQALVRGDLVPPGARRAATVLLLRDAAPTTGDGGPEVFLLRRRSSMAFAAGVCAYPGGSVDSRDETPVALAGPGAEAWARRLGVPAAEAQAIVCAAVRETFEEAGVLLAGPTADQVVADPRGEPWESDRRALVARELSFAAFLRKHDLVVRDDLLRAWARWITPEFERRRYDTWFFVALLPAGQRGRNASTEADHAGWTACGAAVAGYDQGELPMMPPTIATLRPLAAHPDAASALAAAPGRDLAPVCARVRPEGDRVAVTWPGHAEFDLCVDPPPPHGTSPDPDPDPGSDPGPDSGPDSGSVPGPGPAVGQEPDPGTAPRAAPGADVATDGGADGGTNGAATRRAGRDGEESTP